MHRSRASVLAVLATLTVAGLGAALPGPSPGPENVLVLADGYGASIVLDGHPYATSLAFRDGKLLLVENGRYHYAEPWKGERVGKLVEFTLGPNGVPVASRVVATGLADPIGLAVAPNGDVYVSQYDGVSVIRSASFDSASPVVETHSTGYPPQTSDVGYLPVTGENALGFIPSEGGSDGVDTTGAMGLAVRADGQLFVSNAINGRPPDDVILRDVTGLGYDNPYSSAVLAPRGGPLTPDQVAARACRNCFDLAFAPEGHPLAGELFITENVGPYRGRLAAGSGRTVVEGSTPTDQNLLDGVNHVNLETGQIRRVATFRMDSGIFGIVPTGIAFAPTAFEGYGNEMFVVTFGGFVPQTDDRGEVLVVRPEMTAGAGTGVPFATGLDSPIDLAFSPAGDLYVLEYYTGTVFRFARA